ncbi:Ig-like domain-containing protein [Candidatus Palauibacter sp.]|uniref:Ig-like domain-containing protein n=1 Tax=Candidatus Palauibacter sp. TaxID=3101350 RepID=UPI003B015A99
MNGITDRYRRTLAVVSLAALFGVVSCGGDGTTDPPPPPPPPPAPVAPVAVGSIPAQVMTAGQSVAVDVTPFFSDPDGGALTYAAASSDEGVVSVSISGSSLTVTAVAAGTATVTVTATDPDGLTATQSAGVTVEAANRAPEAVGTIPAQMATVGETATVDVAAFFSDPDGDELTYAAESTDAAVIAASVSGSSLTVTAVAVGTATVTVTAADPDGLTATQSAEVTVSPANRAPETVGTIPAQTAMVGETATVDVASFFSDPDGDELTYAAASTNAAVATASMSGSSLTVAAVAAGTATVTVTATDPGGLSASQSAEVTVEAANRAPEAVGTIPAQTATAGETATVDVAAFFSDPDGDELTYAAASTDAAVATASMSGSSLTVAAVAAGTATVTVTATDPGGLSASQSAEVTVEESAGPGFRDDFDSSASLDDWDFLYAEAAVVDGVLRLTKTADTPGAIADRAVDPVLTEWTIRASMGRAADAGAVGLYWFTEDDRYQAFGIVLGPLGDRELNYRFVFWDDNASGTSKWILVTNESGTSDAVRDAPGEFTDVAVGLDGNQLFLMAGDTELWRITPNPRIRTALAAVTTIWLAGFGSSGDVLQFDWVEVTGTESSADMSRRTGAASGFDLLPAAAEISDAKRARPGILTGTRRNRDDR